MHAGEIGVGIINWERAHLLAKLLCDLENQTWLDDTTFHLFNDGWKCRFTGEVKTDADFIERAKLLWDQASIPKGERQFRKENVGIGIHQKEAYDWMCERYEHIVMLENDLRISPHYLRLARIAYEDVLEADNDVAVFSMGHDKHCDNVRKNLGRWETGWNHWWDAIFKRSMWSEIMPHYKEYYELIKDQPYGDRPHEKIRALYDRKGAGQRGTSQDGGKDMALECAGKKRATLLVNRVYYTGKRGVHATEEWYEQHGFKDAEPYVFPSDKIRKGISRKC